MTKTFPVVVIATVLWGASAPVNADSHAQAIDRMMVMLGPQSSRDAATIKRLYRPYLDLLLLNGYPDLASALATAGLAPLPENPSRFNLAPRLDGPHPIGEKDLPNQARYLAARPATIGVLILVASRVRSGPIEITSLVRHSEYQSVLRVTNSNASASVPMHTMGLAFDIALVNMPLKRVYEVRRVLQNMRASGDILFIGERQQLVFHVVPHPSRLGYFTDIYTQAVGAVSGTRVVEVVAPGPPRPRPTRLVPRVVTDVVAFAPLTDRPDGLSAALVPAFAPGGHRETAPGARNAATPLVAMTVFRGILAFFAALATSAWRIARRARTA